MMGEAEDGGKRTTTITNTIHVINVHSEEDLAEHALPLQEPLSSYSITLGAHSVQTPCSSDTPNA